MFIHLFQVGNVFDINVISHKNPTEYKILECPNITIISTLNMNIKMFMCHNKMFRTMKKTFNITIIKHDYRSFFVLSFLFLLRTLLLLITYGKDKI